MVLICSSSQSEPFMQWACVEFASPFHLPLSTTIYSGIHGMGQIQQKGKINDDAIIREDINFIIYSKLCAKVAPFSQSIDGGCKQTLQEERVATRTPLCLSAPSVPSISLSLTCFYSKLYLRILICASAATENDSAGMAPLVYHSPACELYIEGAVRAFAALRNLSFCLFHSLIRRLHLHLPTPAPSNHRWARLKKNVHKRRSFLQAAAILITQNRKRVFFRENSFRH